MEKIRIAIVDDQKLFRQSLAVLVNTIEGFELVAEAGDGEAFLDILFRNSAAIDIAIADMDMPGINGIELNDILHRLYPHIKVIILSAHTRDELSTQMIDAGAAGYLAKDCDKAELIQAIRTVHDAGFYFNRDMVKAVQANAGSISRKQDAGLPVKLTDREMQLLTLICKEYSNAEIAKELYLSVRTVEGHRNTLINKIGCRNSAGIVLFAIKYNLFKGGL